MEPVEMRDVEYILAVEAERNFSRAAGKCYVSQPALSKTVRKVERNLGITIFDRSSQPLKVTREGQRVLDYLRQMQNVEIALEQYCDSVCSGGKQIVTISAAAYFCTYILPPLAEDFRQHHPDCAIRLIEANNGDMRELLTSGMADMGIAVEGGITADLEAVQMGQEHIILAVPADDPVNRELERFALRTESLAGCLKDCPAVPLNRFRDVEFLLLRRGNDLYERCRKMFEDAGFFPKVAMEMEQMMTAYFVAATGRGAAFIRTSLPGCAGGFEGKLRFYKIDHPDTIRRIYLVTARGRSLVGAKKRFAAFLKDYSE